MLRFTLNRLVMAVPTLVLVSIAVFSLVRLIPGDPAALMLGDIAQPDQIAALRVDLGLDKSIVQQFVIWTGNVLRGDFGRSIVNGEPVFALVTERFLVSAQIVVLAVALAGCLAVPAGVIAAWRQNSLADLVLVGSATVLLSIPTFWLGLLLLLLFGLKLGWLPVLGYVSIRDNIAAGLIYLVLPVMTLVIHETGALIRMSRASTLEVLRLDYVTHARAKGLSEAAVLWKHVFRNAFGPTWTMIGLILGHLLGGIAVIETVFTVPGLGRLMVDSILARDYPVIQGCLLLVAVSYVVINLFVDLLYPIFDPRVVAE
ncbi:MAG: ABC transporter permease [Proteobacteria bacterium]|nr:ABC transporter permease [Pseudomonadota bacterium]